MRIIIIESQLSLLLEQSSNIYTDINEYKKALKIYNKKMAIYQMSLELYKERIFNINSGTFKNIMTTLGLTHDMGGVTEDYTVKIIKKEFGDENVEQIGELGNQEDMIGGVDCKVVVNGETKTLQIKPFSYTKDEKNSIMVFNTGQVKKYTTDWIAFANQKKGVLIFDNKNTKIINRIYHICNNPTNPHTKHSFRRFPFLLVRIHIYCLTYQNTHSYNWGRDTFYHKYHPHITLYRFLYTHPIDTSFLTFGD